MQVSHKSQHNHFVMLSYKCFLILSIVIGASQIVGSLFFIEPIAEVNLNSTSDDENKKEEEKEEIRQLDTMEIIQNINFWKLVIIFFINLTPMLGVLSVFASHIRDQFPNVHENEAATYLSIINIVGTCFRLCIGFLSECMSSKVTINFCIFFCCCYDVSYSCMHVWNQLVFNFGPKE